MSKKTKADFLIYRDHEKTDFQDHFHHLNEILLCHEGEAQFTIGDDVFSLKPKSLLILGSLENHSAEIQRTPYDRTVILFDNTYVSEFLRVSLWLTFLAIQNRRSAYVFPLNNTCYEACCAICKDIEREFTEQDAFWEQVIAGKIAEILILLFRLSPEQFYDLHLTEQEKMAMNVQLYILEHYRDDISLEQLNETFYTSTSSLSKAFKDFTGYTVWQYIILNRLLEAKEHLRDSDLSISEIAANVGYDNPNHFSRIFRKYEGMSPTAYRKQYRGQM